MFYKFLFIATILLFSTSSYADQPTPEEIFQDIMEYLDENYVDETDKQELYNTALKAVFSKLDKHSMFFTAEEFNSFNEDTSGKYHGIGVMIGSHSSGGLQIKEVFDGPSKDKLRENDIIVKVDGNDIKEQPLQDTISSIRGEKDTVVVIGIIRDNNEFDIEITRGETNRPIIHTKIINDNIAYLRLDTFTAESGDLVIHELSKLLMKIYSQQPHLAGIVLDLRSNPGGVMTSALKISNIFLEEGVIIEARGKNEEKKSQFVATKSTLVPVDTPLAVIINEHSASASEIVAGALKANNRAVVVGKTSYGKGTIQSVYPFENGTGMKVTTARYYMADGETINEVGVSPDIEVEYDDNDPQLEAAVDAVASKNAKIKP